MRWWCYLMLLASIGSLSCSSDGGPVGTGISSTAAISGNIVDVQSGAATSGSSDNTSAALPPIQVSIDGLPGLTTVTDSGGNFVLSGEFADRVTLRFAAPQFQVTQQLNVPAGSTVVLQDIELQPDSVVAQAVRQLAFFGTVDFVDCTDGTLLIHERRSGGMQYHVQLDDQTNLVDAAGGAQTCAAIQIGSPVTVEGTIDYATMGGTITALAVTLSSSPPPPPQPHVPAWFSGAVAALDCSAGFVVVDDAVCPSLLTCNDAPRTTVRLTAQTRLAGVLGCGDLRLGDAIRGNGQITLRMPGVIVATQLAVTGAPTTGQLLRFVGFVNTIDCASGALQLRDDETSIDVQLSPTTPITGRNGQAVLCADIQPGDRVEGQGQVDPDASGRLDATEITVKRLGLANRFGG